MAPEPRPLPVSVRGAVPPFYVMELVKAAAERAASHGDVIALNVGQPATPAPRAVLDAAHLALESGALGYTEALGLRSLREAIARHYADWYGVAVDPGAIAVTTGSSAAFTAIFLAAFDPGDVVVVTRPGYPAYRNTLAALGCDVVELDCGPEVRYQPTAEQLDALAGRLGRAPRGLVLASPANPTGTVIDPAELARISSWCADAGCLLISDEIYHGITFGDARAVSALESGRGAAVIGSFSKFFSMTGWRLGWAVLPEGLVRPVELLLGNLNLCPPAISQAAASGAFGPEALGELRGHVRRYAVNRELLLRRLPDLGVTAFAPPDGAFYGWLDVSHLTRNTYAWSLRLLEATGVAVAPGIDFATTGAGGDPRLDGDRFIRISLCGATDALGEGIDRIAAFAGR
ncbi:MAG TPA: aminotransferase class I/II-fold pyridoxal phosphate-dependent enzyme [Propionibacteriaceae bacterium]|nr:aminotransferase class I/II-fold pyridoxal phosphate-dependent enzyme [Propionibacteriaceae bacterium]